MTKLHQSKVLANIKRFSCSHYSHGRYWRPRDCIGCYLYWKTCEYFKPKSVLEIGFFEGLSFGLIFEATGPDTSYVCVDKDLGPKKVFDALFDTHPKYNAITFIEEDSMQLVLDRKFDLVHIDGDHSYEYVKNDIEKILPCLHENSILIIDDISEHEPGVELAVNENLLGQHGIVPFLAGDREMFFHYKNHDASEFLDYFLTKDSTDIVTFFNYDYKGFTVFRGHVANFFNDNESIFLDQMRKYNL